MRIVYLWPKNLDLRHRSYRPPSMGFKEILPASFQLSTVSRKISVPIQIAEEIYLSSHPVLSLFARCAKIANIDPTQMQRHRRASSASSQSSISDRDIFSLSRSNSRSSVRLSPNIIASSPSSIPLVDSARNSIPVFSLDSLSVQPKNKRHSVNVKRDAAVWE